MMSIDELRQDAAIMSRWEKHRFLALVAGVILIALFLVSVALSLYNSSGAAQLDLSRPGYKDVRDLAKRDTTSKSFPASGTLDKEALDLFSKLYGEQSSKVTSSATFDESALSAESLQLFTENRTGELSDQQ